MHRQRALLVLALSCAASTAAAPARAEEVDDRRSPAMVTVGTVLVPAGIALGASGAFLALSTPPPPAVSAACVDATSCGTPSSGTDARLIVGAAALNAGVLMLAAGLPLIAIGGATQRAAPAVPQASVGAGSAALRWRF